MSFNGALPSALMFHISHLVLVPHLLLLLLYVKVILLYLLLIILIVSPPLLVHHVMVKPTIVLVAVDASRIPHSSNAIRAASISTNIDAAPIGHGACAREPQRRGQDGNAENANDGHYQAGDLGGGLPVDDDAEAQQGDEDDEEEPADGEAHPVGGGDGWFGGGVHDWLLVVFMPFILLEGGRGWMGGVKKTTTTTKK
jgi:hypothetical protein